MPRAWISLALGLTCYALLWPPLALWSAMSSDPAFAAAGDVAMIAATGALVLGLRERPAPSFGEGVARV